jgi:hypothetical protein
LARSLAELGRVLKPGAQVVMVLQDSYYKELHIDLPLIVAEMCEMLEWEVRDLRNYALGRSIVSMNPLASSNRPKNSGRESVLTLVTSSGART